MKRYNLMIQAKQRPETLERILRIVRHRGFTILKLNSEHGVHITLQLTVQSEREISLLVHQLVKLPDVITVN